MTECDLATAGETVITRSSIREKSSPDLRIFHYNDVYHVESGTREPVGGAARLQTLRNYYANDKRFSKDPKLLTFFSGDALNPSLESAITKGKHMVPILNNLGTNASCLGNHDLDFGLDQFEYLAHQCEFPWLCANVLDPSLGQDVPLGRCKRTTLVTSSNGIKVGLIGLVEQEWLDTINFLPPDLIFLEPSAVAKEVAPQLRAQGAEIVIVLAHQRMHNDARLAEEIEPGTIDIILGGHDHTYEHAKVNGTVILRSGTDFKQFSYIEARRTNANPRWDFDIVRRDVVAAIPPDPTSSATIAKITEALTAKLEKPLGYVAAALDARFTTVRLAESNLGNLVSDLMRLHYGAECCLMSGGTIRGDVVYPPGMLRIKDIMNCFPFEDPCVVIQLSGEAILEALENGVSQWPALDGRFPQVSGISFAFDPSKPPGSRCHDVRINGETLNGSREYSMVTRDYMCHGKDGYHMLLPKEQGGKATSIVPEESGTMLPMLLRQYFMSLKVLGQWRNWNDKMGAHWSRVHADLHVKHPVREAIPIQARTNAVKFETPNVAHAEPAPRPAHRQPEASFDLSDSEDESVPNVHRTHHDRRDQARKLELARRAVKKWWRLAGLTGHPGMVEEPGEEFGVDWTRAIAPRVEGRIRRVG